MRVMGKLIVFEGIYSVGKSTQLNRLAKFLEERGDRVVITQWNSSQLLSDPMRQWRIKRLLIPHVLFLLEVSDFAHRLHTEIQPALRDGATVLADRYVYTAIARGTVRGLECAYCKAVCQFAPRPDLVYHLYATETNTLVRRLVEGRTIDGYISGSDFLSGPTAADRFLKYQRVLQQSYTAQLASIGIPINGDCDQDTVWNEILVTLADHY